MDYDPVERFCNNTSINASLHQIIASFDEPSRTKMLTRIRQHRAKLDITPTAEQDAHARHTYREFLVGDYLRRAGLRIAYGESVGGKTPDWIDQNTRLIVEVFTTERDAMLPPIQRMAGKLSQKVEKYIELVKLHSLSMIVAIHPDFASFLDLEDCPECLTIGKHFERYPELSGVLFFAEAPPHAADVDRIHGQPYAFEYFSNPQALRPFDLNQQAAR